MALTAANGILVLISASLFGVGMAGRGWGLNGNQNPNYTYTPRKIIVGSSSNWTFGFDYVTWAFFNAPFYVNDSLVFRYDPPSENNPHPHNVYLLQDQQSLMRCDLNNSKMVANVTDGSGDGFEFVLSKLQPYYFACGAGNGFHCSNGTMKFSVLPQLY